MTVSQSGRDDLAAGPVDSAADSGSLDALRGTVTTMSAENERLRQRIDELTFERRHAEMVHRDHAIGLTAELETLRERYVIAQTQLRRARDKAARLQKVVSEMRASTTWRLGRRLIGPFARLRGRSQS